MKPNLQDVLTETKKCLGEDVDFSYLTQEVLEEALNADAKEVASSNLLWERKGNTITVVGGITKWKDGCGHEWWQYTGSVNTQRLVNCLTGVLQFKIWK